MSNINLNVNGTDFVAGPVEKALFLVDPQEALNSLTNRLAMILKAKAEDGAENFKDGEKDALSIKYGKVYNMVSGKSAWQVEQNCIALLASQETIKAIQTEMNKITGSLVEKPYSFFKAQAAQDITENKASIMDAMRAGLEA